jgi:hypothetical protein
MSPKYVLTGDEKKIRFRNYFKKKGDLQKTDGEMEPDIVEIEAEPGRDDGNNVSCLYLLSHLQSITRMFYNCLEHSKT